MTKTLFVLNGRIYWLKQTNNVLETHNVSNIMRDTLKCYYDQKFTSLFPSDFKSLFVWHLTSKILNFKFLQRLFSLSASLGFHGLPLFWFKTDGLDFRGFGSRTRYGWRQKLTSLKLQRVNAAYCTCKTRV